MQTLHMQLSVADASCAQRGGKICEHQVRTRQRDLRYETNCIRYQKVASGLGPAASRASPSEITQNGSQLPLRRKYNHNVIADRKSCPVICCDSVIRPPGGENASKQTHTHTHTCTDRVLIEAWAQCHFIIVFRGRVWAPCVCAQSVTCVCVSVCVSGSMMRDFGGDKPCPHITDSTGLENEKACLDFCLVWNRFGRAHARRHEHALTCSQTCKHKQPFLLVLANGWLKKTEVRQN